MLLSFVKFYKFVSRDIVIRWVWCILGLVGIDIIKYLVYSIRVVFVLVVSRVNVNIDDIL